MGKLVDQYKILHSKKKEYGSGDERLISRYRKILEEEHKQTITSVLDYGCGKSKLIDELFGDNTQKFRYDPAIEEYENKVWEETDFKRVDLCISNDVLEHIPDEEIADMLINVDQIAKAAIFTIHCDLAKTILPNGMNAHVSVHTPEWWEDKLKMYWEDTRMIDTFGKKVMFYVKQNS